LWDVDYCKGLISMLFQCQSS